MAGTAAVGTGAYTISATMTDLKKGKGRDTVTFITQMTTSGAISATLGAGIAASAGEVVAIGSLMNNGIAGVMTMTEGQMMFSGLLALDMAYTSDAIEVMATGESSLLEYVFDGNRETYETVGWLPAVSVVGCGISCVSDVISGRLANKTALGAVKEAVEEATEKMIKETTEETGEKVVKEAGEEIAEKAITEVTQETADNADQMNKMAQEVTDNQKPGVYLESGVDRTVFSTRARTNQDKDLFRHANFKKSDIKMVNDAANQVGGIDRKEFGNFIHEIKKELGMKANQNFTYQELIELAKEFKNMTK